MINIDLLIDYYECNDYLSIKFEKDKIYVFVKDMLLEYVSNMINESIGLAIASRIGVTFRDSFITYCMMLQNWVNNDYNTDIMHYSITLHILKELVKAGESRAIQVYKEEIAIQFSKENVEIRKFLTSFSFLGDLSKKEIQLLIHKFTFLDFLPLIETLLCSKHSSLYFSYFEKTTPDLHNTNHVDLLFSVSSSVDDPKSGAAYFIRILNSLDNAMLLYVKNEKELYPDVWKMIISEFSMFEEFQKAKIFIKKILDFIPGNISALLELGKIYKYLNEFSKALGIFNHIRTQDNKNRKVLVEMGHLYARERNYINAMQLFKQAQKIDFSFDFCLLRLGMFYMDHGRIKKTLKLIRKGLKKNPRSRYFWDFCLYEELLENPHFRKLLSKHLKRLSKKSLSKLALYLEGMPEEIIPFVTVELEKQELSLIKEGRELSIASSHQN